jgi:hypothetical protein
VGEQARWETPSLVLSESPLFQVSTKPTGTQGPPVGALGDGLLGWDGVGRDSETMVSAGGTAALRPSQGSASPVTFHTALG